MKTQQTSIAEVSLIYRTKVNASERLQVKCSCDAYQIFMDNCGMDSIEHIEEFNPRSVLDGIIILVSELFSSSLWYGSIEWPI